MCRFSSNSRSRIGYLTNYHIFVHSMDSLHDFDKNRLLDGLEMLAMLQSHDHSSHVQQNSRTLEQNIGITGSLKEALN